MHKSGIIAAFLVVVAAIAASLLTSKLVQVRNFWTGKSVTSRDKLAKILSEIEELETKIDTLKSEFARSRVLWGEDWNSVDTVVAADGTITVSIGTNHGVRQNLVLYGFEGVDGGATIHRGSFLCTAADAENATLKPNWRATPEEVKTWQSGKWRWRNEVPSGYQENFDKQALRLLTHEETLKARRVELESQRQLLVKANAILKLREAELVGGDSLEKTEKIGPEFREGLVLASEQAEEERNRRLIIVDELRRKVRNVQADVERLQAENVELVQRLPAPQPQAEVTQKK